MDEELPRNPANFVPLTPLSFLDSLSPIGAPLATKG